MKVELKIISHTTSKKQAAINIQPIAKQQITKKY